MLPKGFKVGGISSYLSNQNLKKDLAIFISDTLANTAGMFTRNIVKAAPVNVSINRLKNREKFFGIVANSGCANACTGSKGEHDAEYVCSFIEKEFNLMNGSMLCASTGVIGQYFNIVENDFQKKINLLKSNIGTSIKNENDAVSAIMTTDTFIKKGYKKVKNKNGEIKIWGCAKGAGMIYPKLQTPLHATMLSFVLTDAKISNKDLQIILKNSVDQSFNCISVDGDTSTNDTVLVLANGQSNTNQLTGNDLINFTKSFNELMIDLAKSIVKDGEGATKFIEIEIKNAGTKKEARFISSTLATSVLFKTSMFGADANWGRIIAAIGRSGVNFDLNKVDIYIDKYQILKNGTILSFSEKEIKKTLLKKEINIIIDLKSGTATYKYYTCDFSYDYIKINGYYRS
ncbi:MAG: bifunctional glutamate N-acetyltransferase/amino-acid acetyltransferase ArgJ [Endomicrobium sp.]|jgi:glutamate N-acetyltransferase/amino-acid N-acetyltransferase|nr:bifunctional glutamate N-acetyltransferase/amino-acid acetyltransferase ArgJ [Endomicrobium sp.]